MHTTRLKVLLIAIVFLHGCSAIGYSQYFVPNEGKEWIVKAGAESPSVILFATPKMLFRHEADKSQATYQCATSRIRVGEISGFGFGLIGPPVIPMVPSWGEGEKILKVDIEESSPWGGGCPVLIDESPGAINFKLVYKQVNPSNYNYSCRYKTEARLRSIHEMRLKFTFKGCETSVLQWNRKSESGYCAVCIFPLGG